MTAAAVERVARIVAKDLGWGPIANRGEARLAVRLARWGLRPPECVRQFRVGPYRLDFAWPALKVALEADGWVHTAASVYAKDRERDAYLRERGWLVFRVNIESEAWQEQAARVAQVVTALSR